MEVVCESTKGWREREGWFATIDAPRAARVVCPSVLPHPLREWRWTQTSSFLNWNAWWSSCRTLRSLISLLYVGGNSILLCVRCNGLIRASPTNGHCPLSGSFSGSLLRSPHCLLITDRAVVSEVNFMILAALECVSAAMAAASFQGLSKLVGTWDWREKAAGMADGMAALIRTRTTQHCTMRGFGAREREPSWYFHRGGWQNVQISAQFICHSQTIDVPKTSCASLDVVYDNPGIRSYGWQNLVLDLWILMRCFTAPIEWIEWIRSKNISLPLLQSDFTRHLQGCLHFGLIFGSSEQPKFLDIPQ